jgi:multidrug efflux system outer membrane protein
MIPRHASRSAVALPVLALLGSCGLLPHARVERPAVELPAAFNSRVTAPQDAGETAEPLGAASWRKVFTDPGLQALIDEALARGPDGLLAAAQVREAQALADAAGAPRQPSVSATVKTSPIARLPDEDLSSSFLAGLGVSWELDLWGRYARASEAARADLLARVENQRAVRASLVATVADLYFRLAALRETQEATQRVAQNQRDALRLVQRKSAAGIVSAAEERQQESALAVTEARLPVIRRQIAATENALAVLLGRVPGAAHFETPGTLALPERVPAGLPSALLERRPDLRAAEARLVAADARVAEAKARFFPQISLTAVFGGVSTDLGDALNGDGATVASLGPDLLLPLFAGGALRANRDAALARLDQAVIGYRRSVLGAFGEVSDSLIAYETSADLLAIQQRREVATAEAVRLADMRFNAGITTFLEVLDAQRQWLAAETDAAQALLERRQALVRLYLALGGGWEETP